jgi:Putative porin
MKYKKMRAAVLLTIAAGMTFVSTGHAQSVDALLNKLVDKGVLSAKEADDLKQESDKDFTAAVHSKMGMPAWDKNISLGGDFRLRLDDLMPESGLNKADRLRYRFRFRYGAVWTASDWATVGFRLGSGDYRTALGDGNPNSNNQTLTHAFSKKPVFIDAAYVTLTPPGQNWISLTGGKMNNPFWGPSLNSPMVYDPDLTPEGGVVQLKYKFGPDQRFQAFANAGGFVLDELSSKARDIYMYDAQAGLTANLLGDAKSPTLKATVAGGYFLTQNLPHFPVGDSSGNPGNAFGASTNYLGNFETLYARGEVAWKFSDKPFLGTPAVVTFGGEYDQNLSGAYRNLTPNGNQTDTWTAQVTLGQAAKRGQWQIAYQYKHAEADALFDSLTDDDFGGTDRKGHVIKAAYNIRDWWQLGFTAFVTEKISNRPNGGHNQSGISGQDQTRLFFDTMFKF